MIQLRQNIDEYVKNKSWYWYLPGWLAGGYIFIKLLDFKLGEPAPSFFIAIAQSLNFFLHEIAHLLTGFLPDILTAAAGSLTELLLGMSLIVGAFLTRSFFASIFCFLWFTLATQATADYMADAKYMNLPLVSFGGGDPIHDWNFAFSKLGVLEQSELIARLIRATGIAASIFGLLFCGWLIYRMAVEKSKAAHQQKMNEIMNRTASKPPAERADKPFIGGDLYPTAERGNLADKPEAQPKNKEVTKL